MHESVTHCVAMRNSCCRNAERKVTHVYAWKDTQPDYAQVYSGISAAEIPSIGSNVSRDDVMRLMRAKPLAIFPQ
jgi:uncharacterized iron-regulated protein